MYTLLIMQIYSWGYNGNGQLGIGSTNTGYCPQLVKMQTIFTSVCVYNYVILFKCIMHINCILCLYRCQLVRFMY